MNINIVNEISEHFNISRYSAIKICLFYVVKLTKNIDIEENKYSGDGIGFDWIRTFSVGNELDSNCIIFKVDISSSVHVDKVLHKD